MTSDEPIVGTMHLSPDAPGVPDGGLTVASIRVEVSADGHASGEWIAELVVQGELPWHKGEKRKVEIRIMSDEFRQQVSTERPVLVVKRGPETVGKVVF